MDGIELEPTDLVRVDFGHTGLTGNGRPGAVDSSSSSGQPSDQSTVLSVRSMAQASATRIWVILLAPYREPHPVLWPGDHLIDTWSALVRTSP
ncbi:MAG TPA: hypothetical protein VF734_18055 [Pseudonocardiaceae bacterium]